MAGASRRRHPENPPDLVGGPFSTGSWQAGASGQNQSSPVARTAPRGQESPAGAAPDRGDHPAASRDIDAEEGALHGGLRGARAVFGACSRRSKPALGNSAARSIRPQRGMGPLATPRMPEAASSKDVAALHTSANRSAGRAQARAENRVHRSPRRSHGGVRLKNRPRRCKIPRRCDTVESYAVDVRPIRTKQLAPPVRFALKPK